MSEFLTQLDQWALGILMGICTLFGVLELPEVADPHWKVEQRWVEKPGGYFQLIISSETIQEECRSGKAKYIVFPQSYMARQEVYADGIRVYTNEMDKEWHIKSFLDRPVVSCDLLGFSRKIEFKILSFMRYFSTISYWPAVSSRFPKGQFFYNFSYIVVGVLSFFCGVVFFLIGISFKEKSYHLLIIGVGMFFVMYSHYSALAEVLHISVLHQFSLIGIAVIGYTILVEEKINDISYKWNWLLLLVIAAESFMSFSYQHTTQMFMVINAVTAILLVFIFFLSERVTNKKVMLFFVFIFAIRDLYNSQIKREGFLNLSLLCIVITCFMAYRLISRIYHKNLNLILIHKKIENDGALIEKMRKVNFKIKQVIHDMKSPVTSLNFMISSNNLVASSLSIPVTRLNNLLGMAEGNSEGILLDWYSIRILDSAISLIVEEKKNINRDTSYLPYFKKDISVFFDPDLIKLLVAELIDNSIKNNTGSLKIEVRLSLNIEHDVVLNYRDNGVGIAKENLPNLGVFGYTTKGTGLGIFSMFERLKIMGATIAIESDRNSGFQCDIKFASRESVAL